MIKTSNLSYSYKLSSGGVVAALNNVSLEIKKGEFAAIIGANGSGKSTLVRHFNALILPEKGDVWVNGLNTKDKDKLWDIRETVGMIFQNPDNQIVGTIVEEDIAFGPENLQIPSIKIKERVEEALTLAGLQKYRNYPPHLLSGGQKQKVAIASVLAMHSEYMVLDEATTMLDPKGRYEVLEAVRKLNENEGLTIILITHFMEEAALADRVIVLNRGSVYMDDAPYKVFSQRDKLEKISLDTPPVTKLVMELKKEGLSLPETILTVDDFVNEYKQIKVGRLAS